jgi:K+-sensing histidine kinase KdpD
VAANLITCAVQATPAGGKVSVDLALDTTAGTLVFEVTDSGSLLDDSQRSSLFNALWRASEQAKGPAGLSLTASKGIIEQHGGRLELVPSASGNCLRCMLPLNSTPLPA